MNLSNVEVGKKYTVKNISTNDKELDRYLSSLGCYVGADIAVTCKRRNCYIVAFKDGRYGIDAKLANAIGV